MTKRRENVEFPEKRPKKPEMGKMPEWDKNPRTEKPEKEQTFPRMRTKKYNFVSQWWEDLIIF